MAGMPVEQTLTIQRFLTAVNRDIGRELQTASEFISQAELLGDSPLRFIGNQYLRLGAAAMCDATALASEVLSAGGTPPVGPANCRSAVRHRAVHDQLKGLAWASRHYRYRRRLARKLGLVRLAEVFREITQNKRSQLEQILLLVSAGGVTCPSSRCVRSTDPAASTSDH